MAASKVDIWNMALTHLGELREIQSETEDTVERILCSRFYDLSLDATLRGVPWNFARSYFTLVTAAESPPTQWAYAYDYPANCLNPLHIVKDGDSKANIGRSQYEVAQDVSGLPKKIIYTDELDAILSYTVLTTDTTLFPPDFTLAVALHLGSQLAVPITNDANLKQSLIAEWRQQLFTAQVEGVRDANTGLNGNPQSDSALSDARQN